MNKILALIMTVGVVAAVALAILIYSEPEQQPITYTYPVSGEYTSYEVIHSSKGYLGSVSEYTDYGLSDAEKQAMFEQSIEEQNALAGYEQARAVAEADTADSFEQSEEQRIAEYCEDEGLGSCYNIKYTCDTQYYYHLVTIECEDSSYDPWKEINQGKDYACDEWKVTVDTTDFDVRENDESYWENYGYMW
ncbi:MAG: hypothetical protein WC254_05030 [Candidatus Woesearchaeota archaeon]|jgi:hypothetical protein